MNKSIMMGRVVNEPDLRYTQTENGELAIANFRLAVNRKFVRRGDPEADFFSCTAFGRKAEFAEKYLFKGIKILVEGRMQNDNYKNRAGENVYGMRLMIEEMRLRYIRLRAVNIRWQSFQCFHVSGGCFAETFSIRQ